MSTVRLIDGSEVDSDSEAWRAECEARAICNMPRRADRIKFLEGEIDPATKRVLFRGVLQVRGQDAYDKLKSDIHKNMGAPKKPVSEGGIMKRCTECGECKLMTEMAGRYASCKPCRNEPGMRKKMAG